MAVSRTLSVLVFCIILCVQALEQRPSPRRRSKRDFMASMVSFFSNVDKRLAALEASWDNSTEERLAARLEAKMEGEMQEKQHDVEEKLQGVEEKLQSVQDGMERLESMVLELLSSRLESMVTEILTSKMKSSEAKVAELVEAKTNATEERLASLEVSKAEAQSSPASCKYQYQYQYEKEAPPSSGDQHQAAKLETELTMLQEKMSALDKRLQDNYLSVGSLHNARVLAMEGIVHSVAELLAASEQSLKSTVENASKFFYEGSTSMMNTTILASMFNDSKVQLLATAAHNAAVINASIARMEQATKEMTTHVSVVEDDMQSLTERMVASERVISTMRNATEILASMLNATKDRLLAKADDNAAVINAFIARTEQTTKEMASRMSAMENKLDTTASLYAKETENTSARCTDIKMQIEDLKNLTTVRLQDSKEVSVPPQYRRTCQDYYDNGQRTSGVYKLQLEDGQGPMEVYCDMNTAPGWVVFQRRQDGSVDFFRSWKSYEIGFGVLSQEFWLGNKNIHRLTAAGLKQLRVDLQAWNGTTAFAYYSYFSVDDVSSSYKMSVSGYSGTAGDSLAAHSGQKFSTFDRDLDTNSGNCAQDYKSAWWYHSNCYHCNLNGLYGTRGSSGWQYVTWYHWLGSQSLQRTELKLK